MRPQFFFLMDGSRYARRTEVRWWFAGGRVPSAPRYEYSDPPHPPPLRVVADWRMGSFASSADGRQRTGG